MIKDDFIKSKKLTPVQKRVLKTMADGEELTFNKGGGWWLGLEQTNGKLVKSLIRHCAISQDGYSNKDEYQLFEINETGRMFLETGHFWIHKGLLKY